MMAMPQTDTRSISTVRPERPPLRQEEHDAMDRLSRALSAVLDDGQPARLLVEPVKALLTAFGEDWSEGEEARF